MKTIPQPTLQPIDVLIDYGKVLIPTIVTGLVAGAAIVGIVSLTPRYIDTDVSLQMSATVTENPLT